MAAQVLWSESPPTSALPVLPRSSPAPEQRPVSICVPATRHVRTVASSETPGWRSRRSPVRYLPRWHPAPASASQSLASLPPCGRSAASDPTAQSHPCALSSDAYHLLSRWEDPTLTLPPTFEPFIPKLVTVRTRRSCTH